jgi:hypothetical protein
MPMVVVLLVKSKSILSYEIADPGLVSMENKVDTYIMYGEIHGHIVTDYLPE